MERKAPCAECEGKVSTVYFSTQVIWVDVCLFRCFFLFFILALWSKFHRLGVRIRGLYKLFCWHSALALCSASEPVQSGRSADVHKPPFQMFLDFQIL